MWSRYIVWQVGVTTYELRVLVITLLWSAVDLCVTQIVRQLNRKKHFPRYCFWITVLQFNTHSVSHISLQLQTTFFTHAFPSWPDWSPGRSIPGWRANGSSTRRGLLRHTVQSPHELRATCAASTSPCPKWSSLQSPAATTQSFPLLCHGPP